MPEGQWHIAGLSKLNNCEKTLFVHLREAGVADFYWDDDHFFMDDPEHKASVFIRRTYASSGNRSRQRREETHELREVNGR
ncbi:MAG: hypothetical protein R2758_15895 [Bacteroidales bacterium]